MICFIKVLSSRVSVGEEWCKWTAWSEILAEAASQTQAGCAVPMARHFATGNCEPGAYCVVEVWRREP